MNRLSVPCLWLVLGVFLGLSPDARAGILFSSDFNANDGGLAASDLGGNPANPWTYGATAGVGGDGAWFINTSGIVSAKGLTSPTLTVTGTGPVTISFDHRYNLETNFDGGQLLVSVNSGAFTVVPDADFSMNGPTHTISTGFGSPIPGQRAWSSLSAGYATPAYVTSMATLGTLNAGDTIAFRFRAAWDVSVARPNPNWVIDNVLVQDAGATVVPEPSSLVLLGVGAAGVVGYVRRRGNRLRAN